MKRLFYLFMALIMIVCSSCESNGLPSESSNTAETVSETESAEDHSGGDRAASEAPVQKYRDMRRFPVYPNGSIFYHWPALRLSENSRTFRDVRDSFSGKEDSFEGSVLHVSSLNLDLPVPEGFKAFILKGQYMDAAESRPVELEFVREYVFTMMDVEEEKLLNDIRTYLQKEHNLSEPEDRGPGYVVYSFRIFLKEYLPIENLFISLLADTGEYYESGDYYISMGKKTWAGDKDYGYMNITDPGAIDPDYLKYSTREEYIGAGLLIPGEHWPVEQWIEALSESSRQKAFLSPSRIELQSGEDTPFLYGTKSPFRSGTASYYQEISCGTSDFRRHTLQCSNYETSVLSAGWYQNFENALQELTDHPERYEYPEFRYTFSGASYKGQEKARKNDLEMRSGWHSDTGKDRNLRAYLFANVSVYHQIELKDIVVLLKDTDEGLLYGGFLMDPREPHYLTFLEWGWDPFEDIDLEFARKYAEEEL